MITVYPNVPVYGSRVARREPRLLAIRSREFGRSVTVRYRLLNSCNLSIGTPVAGSVRSGTL